MWEDLFPLQPLMEFTVEQYPILIGVMTFVTNHTENQYEILLMDNVLERIDEALDLDYLLADLIAFKEEFEMNVRCPVSVCFR